jgi:hypothetical protein
MKQKKFLACGDRKKMISDEHWKEYEEYLQTLTEEELEIELQWLRSVGIAKQRGSTVTSTQTDTLQ